MPRITMAALMFKPGLSVGVIGLGLSIGFSGCAKVGSDLGATPPTLVLRQSALAENEQANGVYRLGRPDAPGEVVTYIYNSAAPVQAGEPAIIEVEMTRYESPQTHCGKRFAFTPERGRVYEITPRFSGSTCSLLITDTRNGQPPASYRPLPDAAMTDLPDLPPPPPGAIEWLPD